ncbi:DUF4369 domain-containing protein [Mucilaginibacter lappiensis]|uniref:DUF4369 domain-containing protein n=1 Tax=Mucilaginibacter lappiensis TaxID=354630 RepID=A0A1N6VCN1_9SPHI|nr:DUF4369 domain-containing protein [Mucilaginibacter lappiensis]MBB6109100.1 hypothetical protein [Mucilaginibacter lappiensis]MBB6127308.1 hypothetical protein [Mucilaginibacter lappiensis]SIQ75614.1 protein of unknown function [Mucilaginibacter lappiensis]
MSNFRVILIFLVVFVFGTLSTQTFAQTYSLNGKIKGVDQGWVFVLHRQTGVTDSGQIVNSTFTIRGKASAPEFCNFGLSANGVKNYYFGFFLMKGRLTLQASKDSLTDVGVLFKGSRIATEFQQFQKLTGQIYGAHDSEAATNAKLGELASVYTLKHPHSYISAFALASFGGNLSQLSHLYTSLSPEIQTSYFGKQVYNKLKHR